MARALFVCLHNAGRSQMSQALFERAADGRHEADSAGTRPAERLHPEVVAVMRELGIDLAGRAPTVLSDEAAERADVVVTMGWGDECPYIPGKRYPTGIFRIRTGENPWRSARSGTRSRGAWTSSSGARLGSPKRTSLTLAAPATVLLAWPRHGRPGGAHGEDEHTQDAAAGALHRPSHRAQ
jgi:arsenate reductase (thioredoxin)